MPHSCTHGHFICTDLVHRLAYSRCSIKFCWMEIHILNKIWIISSFSLRFVNQFCLPVILSIPLLDYVLVIENTRANFTAMTGLMRFNSRLDQQHVSGQQNYWGFTCLTDVYCFFIMISISCFIPGPSLPKKMLLHGSLWIYFPLT